MKKKIIHVFLVAAISLLILVSQTYSHYYVLMEADFLSPDLSFENPDQEVLPITKQDETNLFMSSASPALASPEAVFAAPFSPFIFAPCSLNQETFVLRC